MSKHTPGPWTLKHVSGSNFANQRFEIRGMFGDHPAAYPIFNIDTSALAGATVCCSPDDARLITAAPELLGALRAIVKQWDYIYPHLKWHDQEYLEDIEFREFHEARAAISKATGVKHDPAQIDPDIHE